MKIINVFIDGFLILFKMVTIIFYIVAPPCLILLTSLWVSNYSPTWGRIVAFVQLCLFLGFTLRVKH